MFTSDQVVDMLNTMLSKVAEASEDKGRAEQRALLNQGQVADQASEIRDLKSKLAKYEAVPGYPIPFVSTSHQLSADEKCKLIKQMVAHHSAGEKINAIKVIREMTGAGLKEAKDCYEAAFASFEIPIRGNAVVDSVERLIKLVKNDPDAKIAMIKEVRAICGIGLKEAKDAVEYCMTGTWDSRYLGGGKYTPISYGAGRW